MASGPQKTFQSGSDGSGYNAKVKENQFKLKENTDFLSSFIKNNNLSFQQDNSSYSSDILKTPLRQSNQNFKGISPQSSVTSDIIISVLRNNADSQQKKFQQNVMEFSQTEQEQQESSQQEDLQESQQQQTKGEKVISIIDNVFNKMKQKYNFQESKEYFNESQDKQSNLISSDRDELSVHLGNWNEFGVLSDQNKMNSDFGVDSIIQKIKNKTLNKGIDIQQVSNEGEESKNKQMQMRLLAGMKPLNEQEKQREAIDQEMQKIKDKYVEKSGQKEKERKGKESVKQKKNEDQNQESTPTLVFNKKVFGQNKKEQLKNQKEAAQVILENKQELKKEKPQFLKSSSSSSEDDEEEKQAKRSPTGIQKNEKKKNQTNKESNNYQKEEDKMFDKISNNKVNFKENFKKLKQLYNKNQNKQPEESESQQEQPQESHEKLIPAPKRQLENQEQKDTSPKSLNYSIQNSFFENSLIFHQNSPQIRKNIRSTSPVLVTNNIYKGDSLDAAHSDLSYSQSIHDQSSYAINDFKKLGKILDETLQFNTIQEEDPYKNINQRDPILLQLFQERSTLESELRKWQSYLNQLEEEQSLFNQQQILF